MEWFCPFVRQPFSAYLVCMYVCVCFCPSACVYVCDVIDFVLSANKKLIIWFWLRAFPLHYYWTIQRKVALYTQYIIWLAVWPGHILVSATVASLSLSLSRYWTFDFKWTHIHTIFGMYCVRNDGGNRVDGNCDCCWWCGVWFVMCHHSALFILHVCVLLLTINRSIGLLFKVKSIVFISIQLILCTIYVDRSVWINIWIYIVRIAFIDLLLYDWLCMDLDWIVKFL